MADKTNSEDGKRVNGKAKEILFQSMELIMKNLQENMEHLMKPKHFEHTQKFIELVLNGLNNKRKFFLLASGRSAFILQCFAKCIRQILYCWPSFCRVQTDCLKKHFEYNCTNGFYDTLLLQIIDIQLIGPS